MKIILSTLAVLATTIKFAQQQNFDIITYFLIKEWKINSTKFSTAYKSR